ncbi:MAG TPA: EAL domain-containing protein [Xenococcaceae cyanobacterium]|jgi:diguanylate cyclase (GGDEF)-like protein/PAS domain S-box-containing protein
MSIKKINSPSSNSTYSEYSSLNSNLNINQELFELLIEQAPTALAIVDRQMHYLLFNQQWLTIHQLAESNIVGISHYKFFPEHLHNLSNIYQAALLGSTQTYQETNFCNLNNTNSNLTWQFSPWYDANQNIGGIMIHTFKTEKTLEPFFDLSVDMLCVVALDNLDGHFKQINLAFQQVLGYSATELLGMRLLDLIHPQDRDSTIEAIRQLQQGITAKIQFENRYRCQNNSYKWLQWTVSLEASEKLLYGVARDITQSRQIAAQLSWHTQHDGLTGIYNRHGFELQVKEVITSAQESTYQHALCYLDIGRFKVINDICGHVAGDELLRQITHLLKQRVRASDILARIGSDEFGLLLKQCPLAEAAKIAHTLSHLIQEFRFIWQDKSFSIGVNIGVVAIDKNSNNFSDILNAADAACYAAKEKGNNTIQIYSLDDQELIKHRGERHWISRINLALEENRFRLYCQKISPLQDKFGIDHYEILLRMIDRQGNLVPPMSFIPAAERYNLMPAIDRWVIKTFFATYQQYCHSQVLSQSKAIYTINLSGASINSDCFFYFLKEQFAQYQIIPKNICFEITETAAIANLATAAQFIRELKELGCSFALDDFGSGMSSLAYLKNLPVDYLKIDGNFVKNIVNDPIDRATVECFNRIGHVMNIQTIAEFVENDDIILQLKELGVDYAQGYGISKPCPLYFN